MSEAEVDKDWQRKQYAVRKEAELAERLADGFGEMRILERLEYASSMLTSFVQAQSEPGRVPMELRVAELVVDQVVSILRQCPNAAALTESLAEELAESGQLQPHRPVRTRTVPGRSTGPKR